MPSTPRRSRFGLFEFDLATRELRREGVIVRLQAQPAQVLCALIERAGEVVTREELRVAVWDSATYVDFDRGLNFCIAQIRATLGDDSTEPRFIRTLPKRGYQFIAPLQEIAAASAPNQIDAKPLASMLTRNSLASPIALITAAILLLAVGLSAGYWLRAHQLAKRHPIVAVARFDNETSNPALNSLADGLTDTLVEQLTTQGDGHFQVIGNARILRLPRDQRDLTAIATSLHAQYVVLGQVQADGSQTRILAHLIRLPDQTHLWVARTDETIANPLAAQSEIAQKIAGAFSPRIVRDSTGPPLAPLQNAIK
jgi:DNA-binding winged helix-turn-helix (wHTH) protein/TolB-like protein